MIYVSMMGAFKRRRYAWSSGLLAQPALLAPALDRLVQGAVPAHHPAALLGEDHPWPQHLDNTATASEHAEHHDAILHLA